MPKTVLTIDGPAGAGKSTVARRVAARLGFAFLDTGALYRAIAYFLQNRGVPPLEGENLEEALGSLSVSLQHGSVLVNGEDVSECIRSPRIDAVVSAYAALPGVRNRLLGLQRDQAALSSLVTEGRDMGTVVFPDAQVKVFLTASGEERARRRHRELLERGEDMAYEKVLEAVLARDAADEGRAVAPLRPAPDAVHVDTDGKSIDEVVDEIVRLAK